MVAQLLIVVRHLKACNSCRASDVHSSGFPLQAAKLLDRQSHALMASLDAVPPHVSATQDLMDRQQFEVILQVRPCVYAQTEAP